MNTDTDRASVIICGREIPLFPGDSPERMRRVADYAERALKDAAARRGLDAAEGAAAYPALLDVADALFLAQDENARLRRDMLGFRERQFELERANARLAHELSRLKSELEAAGGTPEE